MRYHHISVITFVKLNKFTTDLLAYLTKTCCICRDINQIAYKDPSNLEGLKVLNDIRFELKLYNRIGNHYKYHLLESY